LLSHFLPLVFWYLYAAEQYKKKLCAYAFELDEIKGKNQLKWNSIREYLSPFSDLLWHIGSPSFPNRPQTDKKDIIDYRRPLNNVLFFY